MLALGSLYDASTAQKRPSMGLGCGLTLLCVESSIPTVQMPLYRSALCGI